MSKKYSKKFWITFWLLSALFLLGWFLFWNIKNKGLAAVVQNSIGILPIEKSQQKQLQAIVAIADSLLKRDGLEKSFLVLFQNNMEIRPGGGFIGSFGILKIKDGKVQSLVTHDLSNFDAAVFSNVAPPYPIGEIMKVSSWKMRDSNFSPDFAVDAKKAEEFYRLGGGEEQLEGIVGITSNVLTSMLKATGPIEIEGYPGKYDSENAILNLEYQVEKAFQEQGIDRGERKSIMAELAKEIEKKVFALPLKKKFELAKILIADLNQKDIQLNFKNQQLQKISEDANWAGRVDQKWNKDFLMTVDANIGSFKSDFFVKRSIEYWVDLSKEIPTAELKITFQHTAQQRDWMTRNYTDYLRVFVPENSELLEQENFEDFRFGNELGKKYFGAIVRVPIGETKVVTLKYALPKELKDDYNLKIQKQAGLDNIPVRVVFISKKGERRELDFIMNKDEVVE